MIQDADKAHELNRVLTEINIPDDDDDDVETHLVLGLLVLHTTWRIFCHSSDWMIFSDSCSQIPHRHHDCLS